MKHDPRFWDRVAKGYYKRPIADPESYREKLRITREYFAPDTRVLELGCGTGGTAVAHAAHVARVHAVDISERMLDFGRAQARQEGVDNVVFERADIVDFDAPPASYDVVLGLSILHLVDDRDAMIEKVRCLLRPGGVFVSSTVCLGDAVPWFRFVGPIGRAVGLFPLVRVFTEQALVDSLERAGFVIERRWRPGRKKAAFLVASKPAMESVSASRPEADGIVHEAAPDALAAR